MKPSFLLCVAAVIGLLAMTVVADVYMQNPRGSNDRLIGTGRDRNNANRLFDSQNNARGGYNLGNLYYYEGSVLPIEWTAQHGCGNAINNCEFVIQYMCDKLLRDGTQEGTIPAGADTNLSFGRQEPEAHYNDCKATSRNKGLFTSDQKLGQSATTTRQNANGARYGYECAEERDHYPYWRTSPWVDVAVITSEPRRCQAYLEESENVKGRWKCIFGSPLRGGQFIPVTREACETSLDENDVAGVWQYFPGKGLPPPECQQTLFTRENHLGNAVGGYPLTYNWTIPSDIISENCALRIRYNITTSDFPGWENPRSVQAGWDVSNNKGYFPDDKYKMTPEVAEEREYTLQQNPEIDLFGALITSPTKTLRLQLNVNTNQYFRTFEDRSHRFAIRSREGKVPADAIIHNVNVGGKRGNIVQTFPATEYVYMPSKVDVTSGDYVHFQWTGSHANPGNNDGQGKAGTDHSNVLQLRPINFNQIPTLPTETALGTFGAIAGNYPAVISANPLENFLGWDDKTLVQLALLTTVQFGGDMEELDDAGTYFDMAPKQVTRLGIFNYMCTRNNNFSNRSQKGQIKVGVSRTSARNIGGNGASIRAEKSTSSSTFQTNDAQLIVQEGAFSHAAPMSLTIAPLYTLEEYNVDTDDIVSDVVYVSAGLSVPQLPGPAELRIDNTGSPVSTVYIAYAQGMVQDRTADKVPWIKVEGTKTSGSVAYATITTPGTYVVRSKPNVGAIIGIIIGCIILVAVAVFLIVLCKRRADATAMKLAGIDV